VPLKALGHGRQARQAGAAAQGQQQRFNLVVGVLTQQHGLALRLKSRAGQGLVAHAAGGVFWALPGAGLGVHANHGQGHGQGVAHLLAFMRKAVGSGLQTVVDVNGLQMPRPQLGGCA
jgi:hypothetical protein